MAKKSLKSMSGKLLNPTEHKALAKLSKVHEPMLKEMEKWKDQREKMEIALSEQLETIGKILEPFYNQSQSQLKKTFATIASKRRSGASSYPNKKVSSRKKSRVKKSRKSR